jgi:hypothetical protein
MNRILFFFLLFICKHGVFAQQTINGRIVDSKTRNGVSFATVRAMELKNLGAISDENGYFKILLTDDMDSIHFHVSASAYHSKNIYLNRSEVLLEIRLDEKIIELSEVLVRPLKEGEINWYDDSDGMKLYGSIQENGDFVPMMMGLESTGEFHGNAYKLKKMVKVNEIGFHFFLEQGYPDKLYMRIFNTDEKPKLSMNEPLAGLKELTSNTILLDKLTNGFNAFDVSDENIVAYPGYLIIAVTADINNIPNQMLTIYQEKSGGRDVLRFSLTPKYFTIFPPFLPKYMIGFRYVELEEEKSKFNRFGR